MSQQQQNNRISYASIAGRNTKNNNCSQNRAETSRSQSNKQLDRITNPLENNEYPSIAEAVIKNRINNVKKISNEINQIETAKSEPPLETDLVDIPPVQISNSEPAQPEVMALSIAVSELAIEGNCSKIDSPQSQPESAQGASMSENEIVPHIRPKSWSALFKKHEQPSPAITEPSNHMISPAVDDVSSNGDAENTNKENENRDWEYEAPEFKEENNPSCSQSQQEPEPQADEEDTTYIPQEEFDDSSYYPMGMNMLPTAYMPPPYGYSPYGYMVPPPMTVIPGAGAYFPPQGFLQAGPMEPLQMVQSNVPPGPSGAIAHPVHGMVYYQYDPEVPMDAMMPGLYQPLLLPQPVQRPIKPLMSLQTNPDGVTDGHKPQIDGWNNAVDAIMFEQKIAGKMDLLICDRYQTYLKISRGSCGTVFAAVDLLDPNRRTVAIKFEEFSTSRSNLTFEYEAYKCCSTSEMNDVVHGTPTEGFARIYWMGSQYKYKILIMELLGPSLENLFQYSMREFSPETIFRLGNQMLDRIEHFHRAGFIHRDVKPDNFAVGLGEHEDTVYLIDFGLSQKFRNIGDKEPSYRKDRSLVGTAKYASINSHKGMQLARRDDLESIGYILVEFINGELPWKAENWANASRDTIYKNMLEVKKTTNWGLKCPKMAEWMKYVSKLSFDDMPNYNYLRELLVKYLESARPNRFSSLAEHMSKCTFPISQQSKRKKSQREEKNEREREKTDVWRKVEQSKFEWKIRREFCPNDRYSYECLFRWTLPFGQEPQRPPGLNPSNVFGTGPGEGGFA